LILPRGYTLDPLFANENYLYKIVQTVATAKYNIWTYYSGFCMIEAIQIASGLGYGKSAEGVESFNNIQLINILKVEGGTNVN